MVRVSFTANLARHIQVESVDLAGETLSETFELLFMTYPALQPYIFDEQGQLRKHIMLAIDQQLVQGDLSPYLTSISINRLHIMQALSGG